MRKNQDAYGEQLLAQYKSKQANSEIIERDDLYIDTGSEAGIYFSEYKDWLTLDKQAIKFAKGRVLDVGCGAGRHALYLQQKGFDVTGIDNSPGAIKVCKLRGLKKALARSIEEIDKFKSNSFDTIQMFGNNFGLFGSRENARNILKKMLQITSPEARIVALTLNPYMTDNPHHLAYSRANKKRGRMGGQIRFRIRFGKTVGEWFDYLFVSPEEMKEIISETDWQIEKFINAEQLHYAVILTKKN